MKKDIQTTTFDRPLSLLIGVGVGAGFFGVSMLAVIVGIGWVTTGVFLEIPIQFLRLVLFVAGIGGVIGFFASLNENAAIATKKEG